MERAYQSITGVRLLNLKNTREKTNNIVVVLDCNHSDLAEKYQKIKLIYVNSREQSSFIFHN